MLVIVIPKINSPKWGLKNKMTLLEQLENVSAAINDFKKSIIDTLLTKILKNERRIKRISTR